MSWLFSCLIFFGVLIVPGFGSNLGQYWQTKKAESAYHHRKFELATSGFKQAMTRPEYSSILNYDLGTSQLAGQRWADAAASLSQVQTLEGSKSDLYYHLGLAEAGQGQDREAIAAFKRALLENPKDLSAKKALELVLKSNRQKKQPSPQSPKPGQKPPSQQQGEQQARRWAQALSDQEKSARQQARNRMAPKPKKVEFDW